MSIRFDEKVVIVTGAGGGLGREHALEFARRGAKVVVNDLGGSVDGNGASDSANEVVEQIKSEGGDAIANGASVTDLDAVKGMVDETMKKWGRVDVLVNNAGILRDSSFSGHFKLHTYSFSNNERAKLWENNLYQFLKWRIWKLWSI